MFTYDGPGSGLIATTRDAGSVGGIIPFVINTTGGKGLLCPQAAPVLLLANFIAGLINV